MNCFNPSIEGQPLQPKKAEPDHPTDWVSIPLSRDSHCNTMVYMYLGNGCMNMFQSLCRGTAIATIQRLFNLRNWMCFNPSVEGQPLQHWDDVLFNNHPLEFQSLCRGTAIATWCIVREVKESQEVSIPLSRDSHCNAVGAKKFFYQANVSIPLSRDSHCNFSVSSFIWG